MKKLLVLILIVAVIAQVFCQEETTRKRRRRVKPRTPEEKKEFQKWRQQHRKRYRNQEEETEAMEKLFANKEAIDEHNKKFENGEVSFKRGLFKYSDMSPEEKRENLGGLFVPPEARALPANPLPVYPTGPPSVDWGKAGIVGPVQDQGWCGSCWAFSAAAVIESYFLKQNKSFVLSPQQLVDCSTRFCWGCRSGWPKYALDYVRDNGIADWEDYPYKGYNQTCEYNNNTMSVGRIKQTNIVKMLGNETLLRDIVAAVGPVSAVMCLSEEFYNYESGIFSIDNCCKDIQHAVTITGYGTENGTDYWIVKNSWSESWGEKGYAKFARNQDNLCGIGYYAVWAS